jgi:tRNA (mo5U34)-methyltransferase
MTVDFAGVWRELEAMGLADWAEELKTKVAHQYGGAGHGDLDRWMAALAELRDFSGAGFDVREGKLQFRVEGDVAASRLKEILLRLSPWRKGPFWFGDVFVDTEWRSDWKWERIVDDIAPLEGRRILDVGCGNGYHLWRMLDEGARLALGIDPAILFGCQFLAARHFAGEDLPVGVLPLGIEEVPERLNVFDTVFSMGVLYHRKSPIEHLEALRQSLRPGGEVVLDTLVVDGDERTVLLPEGRYAQMRNVWFLPSVDLLAGMMRRVGFKDVAVIDVTPTTVDEQRATEWMRFQSLVDFLDSGDSAKTVEGYPGPVRAVLRATS